eukprot:SAG25_NODE_11065_length_314_cov_1.093023_1_plen_104_part_11
MGDAWLTVTDGCGARDYLTFSECAMKPAQDEYLHSACVCACVCICETRSLQCSGIRIYTSDRLPSSWSCRHAALRAAFFAAFRSALSSCAAVNTCIVTGVRRVR